MTDDSTIDLRPAEPHEASAIAAVVRAAYARWVTLIGREPMPMQVDYEKAIKVHHFDLAVERGEIVGLIETMQHPNHLWIENVAVLPSAQGKGIGKRLLAFAEIKALATQHSELRLVTNAAFKTNVALYQRLGYIIDRQEPFLNGMAVFMSKRVSP